MPRLKINPTMYMRANSETLLSKVLEVVDDAVCESKVLTDHDDTKIPTFYLDELTQGRVLGRGGFCVVREIDEINLRSLTGKNKGLQGIPSNVTTSQRVDLDIPVGTLDDDLFDEGNKSSRSSNSSKSNVNRINSLSRVWSGLGMYSIMNTFLICFSKSSGSKLLSNSLKRKIEKELLLVSMARN